MPLENETSQPSMEQISEFRLRRSVVIGLGGTGRHVCTQLKKFLRESYGGDDRGYPHVRILSIDTDAGVRTVEEDSGGHLQLTPEERLGLRIPPNLGRERFNEFLTEYAKKDLLPHANEIGAMRHRPLGHAFLVTQWAEVRRKIRDIYLRLHDAELRDLVRSDPRFEGREMDNSRVDFYVIANLVSGTGSGMALGMGYLLRDLIQELKQDGGTEFLIEGVFTTCGLFALQSMGGRPSDYAVNCYAALLELNHFSKPEVYKSRRGRYRAGFDEVGIRDEALANPPYDMIQLLNPSHTGAGGMNVLQFEPYIARVLALRTGSHVGMTASAKIVDERAARGLYDSHGNRRICWAWGAESFRSSGQEILDLAVVLGAQRLLSALSGMEARDGASTQERAVRIASSLGFGFAAEEASAQGTPLMSSLLTPSEPIEGGAPGVSLLESIMAMVRERFPMPPADREVASTLPDVIERRKPDLLTRVRGLISAVTAGNRRRVAEEAHSSLVSQIRERSDLSSEPAGSLGEAIRLLDFLIGRDRSESGLLRQDSAAYQTAGRKAAAEKEQGQAKSSNYEQSIRRICRMGPGFTQEALQSAWNGFTGGLIEQLQAEARQRALEELYRILEGDGKDRSKTLRLGLLKVLEQLRRELSDARVQVDELGGRYDVRRTKILHRLRESTNSYPEADRQARDLVERVLGEGEGLRTAASEWLHQVGSPHQLGHRYQNSDLRDEDSRALEKIVRRRVEAIGQDLLLRSLEDDPSLGGRLTTYLEKSQPAIRLNPDMEATEQVAFVSIPAGTTNYKSALARSGWLEQRSGIRSAQELLEERLGDSQPRTDVLAATLTFSPASVMGVDDWARHYQGATSSSDGLRAVHTVADRSGGRQLVFEPLGTTRPRIELAYAIGLACGWLQSTVDGASYTYPGDPNNLIQRDQVRTIELPLDHLEILDELRRPLREGVNDVNLRIPIFLHILRRFQGTLDTADPWTDPENPLNRFARALREWVNGWGRLKDNPLLPDPEDDGFQALDYAIRCLLAPQGLYEPLRDLIQRTAPAPVLEAARRGGAGPHAVVPLPSARRCPEGHPVSEGQTYCEECGKPVVAPEIRSCSHCHQNVSPGAKFCSHCGGRINPPVAVQA